MKCQYLYSEENQKYNINLPYLSTFLFPPKNHLFFFFALPRKQSLTLYANCLLETICIDCQTLFSGGNKKDHKFLSVWFVPRMLKITDELSCGFH